jgi:apolipoprotein N-acyltransferase
MKKLSLVSQFFLFVISLFIVAFAQPHFPPFFSILAGFLGYTLFFRILLDYDAKWRRFWLGTLWFSLVQGVQLFWFLSHPFFYIYPVYLFLIVALGLEFGLISLLIKKDRVQKSFFLLFIASVWTILEWSRLFFLSGFSWNPIGLSLTTSIFSLQTVSILGIFGLSFWVLFVNLLGLKIWILKFPYRLTVLYVLLALSPYFYGFIQLKNHEEGIKSSSSLQALLVHTSFPAVGLTDFKDRQKVVRNTLKEWEEILLSLKTYEKQNIDLIVLPEYALYCGTYSCLFPFQKVKEIFENQFSNPITFPPLTSPWAREVEGVIFVNNAFIAKTLATLFKASVIVGLEDVDEKEGIREYVSAAFHFSPQHQEWVDRYEKRVLVPLGEYIPFEFCRKWAANYGVFGSFTPGSSAKVFESFKIPFGLSICYEETFGHLMRESKVLGADLLINLSSDAWYPNSSLPKQHFYHARLRAVENGIPLIRATNMGLTGGVDSFGRVLKEFSGDHLKEWGVETVLVSFPHYTYTTLYARFGDYAIIFLSFFIIACFLIFRIDFKL